MITKKQYNDALKIIKQYKKEQEDKWSCEKCKKHFINPFDEPFCRDDFDLRKNKDCKGKNYIKIIIGKKKKKYCSSMVDEECSYYLGGSECGLLKGKCKSQYTK